MSKYLENSLLFLCSLLVSALLCEGVFYVMNRFSPPVEVATFESTPNEERQLFFQYHSVYGYAGLPNVRRELYGEYVTHNSKGLRGPEIDYDKPEGVRRIVFVGDSQTWGWSVGDDETIPFLAERLLNEKAHDTRYQAVNFGATGYGVDQSYLRLISEGLRYEPDFVVLTYFADNDIWETTSVEAWGVEKPYIYEKEDGRLCVSNVPPRRASGWPSDTLGFIAANRFDFEGLRFGFAGLEFDLAKTQTATYFKNRSLNPSLFGRWGSDDSNAIAAIKKHVGCLESEPGPLLADWNEKIELTLKLIYRMRDTAEAHGARFFVVAKPLYRDYRSGRQEHDYRVVIKNLKEHDVNLIDLYVTAKMRRIPAEVIFQGAGHLSPEGNRVVAETLRGRILQPTVARADG